ncbi:MAG TPA: Ig-like domain-containing protein, partial [Longimicrobiales bacterium]|nr:Ig-like domain-containing protein [Longimicrobiales bacterium]
MSGPGGVELRIPEGAVDKGVVFKIAGLTPEELETEVGDALVPEIEGATLGSALRIEAPSKPTFKREVDLVFPMPAGVVEATAAEGRSPEHAFFYVYKRWTGPEGSVLFETLDWARPECPEGAAECAPEEKVIQTASFPFPGLLGSAGALSLSPAGIVAIGAAATAHAYLMWTYASQLPGQPTSGVVTGRVVRPEWPAGATTPVYVGVPGVPVWGKDAEGQDLVTQPQPGQAPQTVATTDSEGRFTFFDSRFTTGTLEVRTQVGGVDYAATAYAVQMSDTKLLAANPALARLAAEGRFGQVATVEITVASEVPPPPPPAVAIHVMKLLEGQRVATDGVVVRGTPVLIGFEHSANLDVVGAEVDGQTLQVVADTLVGTTAGSPLAMDKIGQDTTSSDGTFTPQRTGRFTVKVSARPVVGELQQVLEFEATFLVVEGGEENREVREGEPPAVITASTLPRNNAGGVPVDTLPTVVFTEPVTNVPAGIFLEEVDEGGSVVETIPLSLLGVKPTDSPEIIPVVGPTDTVVSVTLEPQRGLKYRTSYQLRVTGAIEDKDSVPNALTPEYQSRFTTFGPEGVGGTEEQFISPGLVVLGERAYVLETAYAGGVATGEQYGYLRTYDISDPVEPVEITEKELVP